ncbi:MAG TPA: hypothetical protein VGY54_18240, partial [Polyangiaceae bacterium]|nr:hypothetical protein [Polyangiaceae bacterium]
MSAPRDTPDSSENLLLRAREGKLSDAQRRDLERALEMSETLRVAYRVGRDFDRLCAVQAGDDERIARAAGRALGVRLAGRGWAARTSGPGGRARRLAISLGIAAVLVVSSTAAWTGIVRPILRWRGAV